jgi:hypothetical protein
MQAALQDANFYIPIMTSLLPAEPLAEDLDFLVGEGGVPSSTSSESIPAPASLLPFAKRGLTMLAEGALIGWI